MDINLRCAVVIGPSQLDMCVLKRKGKTYVVKSIAYYDFEEEKEIEDIVYNLAEHLHGEILTNVSLKHQSVIEHVYFYKSSVDVKSSVFKDLKRDYEIELKDYIIDYEEDDVSDKKIVYVVAVPKNVFDFYYSMFQKEKKFKLYSFETHNVSLKRAVSRFLGSGYFLNCAVFKNYSSILVCKGNRVLAIRNLRYSWKELIGYLCEAGGISEEDAEGVLRERGLKEPKQGDQEKDILIYQSISEAFDQFTIEIQRTIDYITTVQKIGNVEKLVSIGELNKINKVESYISKLFSLETIKFEPQKVVEFEDEIDFSILKNMEYFETCIGAAIRQIT